MIPRTPLTWQTHSWQKALANAIRDPKILLERLQLDAKWLPAARAAAQHFSLRVPTSFVDRMESGNPLDPLLRQVLPLQAELASNTDFLTDPVGDSAALCGPGVLHKYHGRALLISTGACPIHCRYCFRRHFPYQEQLATKNHWQAATDHLAKNPATQELILSGGDPLMLSNRRLNDLLTKLQAYPKLRRLRIHTRMPIVIPQRIEQDFLALFDHCALTIVMVVHCNHPNEISPDVAKALQYLQYSGIKLFNQAVLLQGVNDELQTLTELSEKLFHVGVLPYYLHQMDKVQGAAHFEVEKSVAKQLYGQLLSALPGYLVPKLVQEQAGMPAKTPLSPQFVVERIPQEAKAICYT